MRFAIGSAAMALAAAMSLGGCASIVGGGMQSVSVSTVANGGHVVAATCELTNQGGTSFVPTTPNTAEVYRGSSVLRVVCTQGGAVIGQVQVKPIGNTLMASYPSHIVVKVAKVKSLAAVTKAPHAVKG